jgi:transglutaminase-like putative cysteine protease
VDRQPLRLQMLLEALLSTEQSTQREVGLLPGKFGIIQTLKTMRDLARRYKSHPAIRKTATMALAHVVSKSWRAEAEAIFEWVRANIRYTLDIDGVETLYYPDRLLESRHGDCDDMSLLLATMLLSVGHPSRFVAVGLKLHQLSHVYVETLVGEMWIAADPTEPYPFGWSPPDVVERFVMHV